MMIDRVVLVFSLATIGCSSPASDLGLDAGSDGAVLDAPPSSNDPQLAPQGHAAMTTWLAAGHYLTWACENAPHPARPPGAHGTNRICSNTALSGSTSGAYPVGAVSVKEIYRNGAIDGYAVARKLPSGTGGASWYWYELLGTSVVADGVGVSLCAGCHDDAPRDFIFTRVE
jgi:hypothetical protein